MNNREKTSRSFFVSIGRISILLIILLGSPAMLYAQGGLTLTNPTPSASVNDTFRIRTTHPKTGVKHSPHRGMDYGVGCGNNLQPRNGGRLECITQSGYGGVGNVYHSCGVTEKYAHLQGCNEGSGNMVTGGAAGMTGAGTSTGCHLHYEIRINDVAVDPQEAYNQDLCNPDVQKRLIDSAQNKLNGRAGGGGGGGGSSQPTDSTPGSSVTYVPPGGAHPVTGVINPGGGYYFIDHGDGRTEIVVDPVDVEDVPGLPPGTPPNLAPTTDTDNEVTGCATDTWAAMVNQSVLQTRREMIANQTYIAKPDSVMAYSCLTEQIDSVREDLGPIFSETKRWVNVDIDIMGKTVNVNKELGEYSLDGAIVNVALEPYEAWMRGFFAHDFLGGTEGDAPVNHGDHAHAEDQAYTPCGAMAQIWQMAKCRNADDEQMFYKFEDLIGSDPRRQPHGYACNNTGITQAMIDTARGNTVMFDEIDPYIDRLFPGEGGECAPPIMTGATVVRREVGTFTGEEDACALDPECDLNAMRDPNRVSSERTHPDGICITAGCTYLVDEDGRGSCVTEKP